MSKEARLQIKCRINNFEDLDLSFQPLLLLKPLLISENGTGKNRARDWKNKPLYLVACGYALGSFHSSWVNALNLEGLSFLTCRTMRMEQIQFKILCLFEISKIAILFRSEDFFLKVEILLFLKKIMWSFNISYIPASSLMIPWYIPGNRSLFSILT